jgi:muramoyltetrapeptide carboxypeptidase
MAGIRFLKKIEFQIEYDEIFESRSILPKTIPERTIQIINALKNKPNMLLTSNGGIGATEILDVFPYGDFKKANIPIMGLSDTTALLLAITKHCNMITFNGPSTALRIHSKYLYEIDRYTLLCALYNLVDGYKGIQDPFSKFDIEPLVIYPGKVQGTCLGGNMTVLCSMLGSDHLPTFKDSILFLEDINIGAYEFRRLWSQLTNAGIIDQCKGFVFGEFTNEPIFDNEPNIQDYVYRLMKKIKKPCLVNMNFSHGITTTMLPIGGHCQLNTDDGVIFAPFVS